MLSVPQSPHLADARRSKAQRHPSRPRLASLASATRTLLTVAVSAVLVGAVLAVGSTVTATPTPAWAHSKLIASQPAADATVTETTQAVLLTFSEAMKGQFSTVLVTGPAGEAYNRGPVRAVDTVVTQDVYPLRSGPYRVAWRVVSTDGHPISGEFHFTVRLSAQLEPTARPPGPTQAGGSSAASPAAGSASGPVDDAGTRWWWLLATVATVTAVAAVATIVARRRRRPPNTP